MLTQKEYCGIIILALSDTEYGKPHARVVELVDSLASGASVRKDVRVRLPPRAPDREVLENQYFPVFLLHFNWFARYYYCDT